MQKAAPERLGVQLAVACLDGNLSAAHAALILGVSVTTVYMWFRGRTIREDNFKPVENLIKAIRQDIKSRRLPAKCESDSLAYAKKVMEDTD